MQEMARELFKKGDPSLYWTYQDETYVGFISSMATSRGGPQSAAALPESVFTRYSAL